MSRVGKMSIDLPEGVRLDIQSSSIKVVGPKGELEMDLPRNIEVETKDSEVSLSVKKEGVNSAAIHGTTRALLANMIKGVAEGWSKTMELVGTGYRAELKGNTLVITIGYSHPVEVEAPEGITFKVEKTLITVEGIDRQLVGQVAANIRKIRPPEPYKGKGIKYQDEVVRRKPGKAAKAQAAA